MSMPLGASCHRDDGTPDEPGRDSPWDEWVAPSRTFNYCSEDPLVDWLELHGRSHGFVPDNERGGYDERTDFRRFLVARAEEFESAVCSYLGSRYELLRICSEPAARRTRAAADDTWQAMRNGAAIIAQGVLWNPANRTYGSPDLLVRSDVLETLFPDDLPHDPAVVPAGDLPLGERHYRVVDIKFTTLDLLKDGHAAKDHLKYMVQVWLYNEALGRMQGFTPPAAFLLGRKWKTSKERGRSALDRLARVDSHHEPKGLGVGLGAYALAACDWVRRVRSVGADWVVFPSPTVSELWPNLRRNDDQPWHAAKRDIAIRLEDLTILPRVTPEKREQAIAAGISRWTDPACSAQALGITGEKLIKVVDSVIHANRSSETGPFVFPERIKASEALWREPAELEFYVDFETVNDLDDDFSRFPEPSGKFCIFMIGCGHFSRTGETRAWNFRTFTVESLDSAEERRIIEEWIAYLQQIASELGTTLEAARLFHWSPAETSTLTDAYNAAHVRQGLPPWPDLPWCDLLNRVIREEPVTVRGAFGFGLKAIGNAMQGHGLIPTRWEDGPADGLGAMVGAWSCHREAQRNGGPMSDLDLMREITSYNEVDCRVMAEVLSYLRRER